MRNKTYIKPKLILSIISCLAIFGLALVISLNRQYISDQLIVWSYSPTEEIGYFATRTGLNDNGKFIYLASKPTLDGTQTFSSVCGNVENVASILGCYTNKQIYIYDVHDTRLDGIREVTAVHETLHAIYARLSSSEKAKLNVLLEAEYAKIKDDANFKSRMDFYARTEPGQVDNELHSVIGTEVANISPELESYYRKYFVDRQKVVALNRKYLDVFDALQSEADAIYSQIDLLGRQITSDSAAYNQSVQQLNSDIDDFNYRANNNYFNTQYQFNAERSELTYRISSLESMRVNVNSNIKEYDSLMDQYNSIATESKKLYNSLDSSLAPAPSI